MRVTEVENVQGGEANHAFIVEDGSVDGVDTEIGFDGCCQIVNASGIDYLRTDITGILKLIFFEVGEMACQHR